MSGSVYKFALSEQKSGLKYFENTALLKPLILIVSPILPYYYSEGCTLNSWKRRRKGKKMSLKSDSFEYMNYLEHQKIWGSYISNKKALTLQTFIIYTFHGSSMESWRTIDAQVSHQRFRGYKNKRHTLSDHWVSVCISVNQWISKGWIYFLLSLPLTVWIGSV